MTWIAVGTLAVTAATAVYKGYKGKQQEEKGKRDRAAAEAGKKEYTIPQELYDNLSDAEKKQVEGLPAEMKRQFVQNIERSQQSALKASADRKGGLLGVQESFSREKDAFSNLVGMDAAAMKESELRKEENIRKAKRDIAGAKDVKFGYQQQDYENKFNQAQANIGAGMQNQSAAGDTIAGAAMTYGASKYDPNSAGRKGKGRKPNDMGDGSSPTYPSGSILGGSYNPNTWDYFG